MSESNRQYDVRVSKTQEGIIFYDDQYFIDMYDDIHPDVIYYELSNPNGEMLVEGEISTKVDEVDIICEMMHAQYSDITRIQMKLCLGDSDKWKVVH